MAFPKSNIIKTIKMEATGLFFFFKKRKSNSLSGGKRKNFVKQDNEIA